MSLKKILTFFIVILYFFSSFSFVYADVVSDLQQKINDQNAKIKALQADIDTYTDKVNTTTSQEQTLQSAISVLDNSAAKLSKQIQLTQDQIIAANLTIQSLTNSIGDKVSTISSRDNALATSLRQMNSDESNSLLETMLTDATLSGFFNSYETESEFQASVKKNVEDLKVQKSTLESNKADADAQKQKLLTLQTQLGSQQKALQDTKKQKSDLLAQTKNQESSYKKILAQKKADEAAFEQDLFNYQAQLKIAINHSLFPEPQQGILSWPLDKIVITQLFGRTVDAQRLYASGSHDGVDFGASVGTPVKAVSGGVVQATGDTDLIKGCYSYGRWVLIKHDNGLSTISAHLSVIGATPGQIVRTGDVIGLSGATGYVTGPHLHLGLYASQAVTVQKYTNSINCKGATIPIAPLNGYLDPMVYLPKL